VINIESIHDARSEKHQVMFLVLSFTQLFTVFVYTSPSSLSVLQFPFVEFHWFAFQNNLATKKQVSFLFRHLLLNDLSDNLRRTRLVQ